ncbi:MAG: c-type cytochrome biogenesis protein CcmI [Rhodocyclaceae bacterium]|nr:c-type cytochrome biogenesis protein CcmI [Rhodocyclaceae bacterium]
MSGFLIGAALALAVTLLLLLRPFIWQRARAATATHRQLNAAIYRDQLAEIERDRNAGTLAEEDYRQARDELQRRVLEDGQDADAPAVLRAPKKTLLALALLLPAASVAVYALLGNPAGLNPSAPEHQITTQEIDRMVASLAAKLEKEPDNLKGWSMLARSYKAMGRVDDAEKAFEHAAALVDTDAQLLADYADVLATKAGGSFAGKPQQMIEKALKLDPDNLQALWLAGSAAYDGGRYDQAVGAWSHLLKLLPPESDDAKQIAAGIADARAKAGKPAAAPVVDAAKAVRGRIELADAVRDRAAPGDTVMVVAREAGGPRMPLAVLRLRVADLPRDFALDDSLAMTPDRLISSAKSVEVEARVSKSGQAMPQAGDLFSATQKAKAGTAGLRLVIDQVRP